MIFLCTDKRNTNIKVFKRLRAVFWHFTPNCVKFTQTIVKITPECTMCAIVRKFDPILCKLYMQRGKISSKFSQ